MARDHSRILLSIWADDDWRGLSPLAQHLYLVILTQPTMTYAGVADWRPARLRAMSRGWTKSMFNTAAVELSERLYIFPDDETEEVLVRSFVKHDGLMKQKNMAVAMCRAYEGTASAGIRGVFIHELKKLHESDPRLAGWANALHLLENRSVDPSDYPSWNPSVDPSNDPSGTDTPNPSDDPPPTPSPSPSPISLLHAPRKTSASNAAYSDDFESFWATYPRREAKRQAWKAWQGALRRASAERITTGAARYRDDLNREDEYTKHASTWLNADGWDDDPLPQRNGTSAKRENSFDAWGMPAGQPLMQDPFIDAEAVEFKEIGR